MEDYNINFLNKNERECLETILIPYGLYVMNKELPIRVVGTSKTLIDYIITDHLKAETFETHVSDTPFRTSKNKPIDHRATSIINVFQINTNKKVIFREIFDKKNYRKDLFSRDLESSDWSRFYRQNSAEDMFSVFSNILERSLEKCITKTKVFIRNDKSSITIQNSWIENEIKKMFAKMKTFMHPDDFSFNLIQQSFCEKLNENRLGHKTNIFKQLPSDRQKWNFINEARSSRRCKTEIVSLKNSFGNIITDQKKIVNFLNYRFSKLGDYIGSKQKTFDDEIETRVESNVTFNFQPITLYTCKKFVKELNINKPFGPSNIPAWVLKNSISVIAEPLCFLIIAFLNEGKFPSDLKQAHVCQIVKKSDTEDPNNYRPISITSASSKVFEKVIRDQITYYIDNNKLFSPLKFGFRKNISKTDAMVSTTEKIRKEIDNNHFVAGAFLDLSKASDSISHELSSKSWKKLHFDPNAISLIQTFLTGRTQRVVLSTSRSDWIILYQGVPQGTVLGPLLFYLYVNCMQNIMPKSFNLVQYADDTFVFVAANCIKFGITNLERIL